MKATSQLKLFADKKANHVIRIYLSDWLYNAGIIGFLRIVLDNDDINRQRTVSIGDNYIEFSRKVFKDFTEKFFETAFKFHGKFDSINGYLRGIKNDLEASNNKDYLKKSAKKFKIENDEKATSARLVEEIAKRWKGKVYESLCKINKSKYETLSSVKELITKLLKIQKVKRENFVEKEVQTFLRRILGRGRSFLSVSCTKNQKGIFKRDFEKLLLNSNSKAESIKCVHCNTQLARKGTIFNTGVVRYQGLNPDSLNFAWNFNSRIPICEFCEIIYFCHWAGFTHGFNKDDNYLFVNDDSNIESLWKSNQLLKTVLQKDKAKNVLVEYFYELLLRKEKIRSDFALQNIAVIQVNLESEVMPKIFSLQVSKNKASFIKLNHERLQRLSAKNYKIKDDSFNLLEEFLSQFFTDKLNFLFLNRLTRFYMMSRDETKKKMYKAYYSIADIQSLLFLTKNYFSIIKQKLTMETNAIWYIYHLGNNLKAKLKEKNAENKIDGIAYRLLNAIRSNDTSTFLNLLMRIYIGYSMEVPKKLVNTLEGPEQFQVIGHSFVNGLLGEPLKEKN